MNPLGLDLNSSVILEYVKVYRHCMNSAPGLDATLKATKEYQRQYEEALIDRKSAICPVSKLDSLRVQLPVSISLASKDF